MFSHPWTAQLLGCKWEPTRVPARCIIFLYISLHKCINQCDLFVCTGPEYGWMLAWVNPDEPAIVKLRAVQFPNHQKPRNYLQPLTVPDMGWTLCDDKQQMCIHNKGTNWNLEFQSRYASWNGKWMYNSRTILSLGWDLSSGLGLPRPRKKPKHTTINALCWSIWLQDHCYSFPLLPYTQKPIIIAYPAWSGLYLDHNQWRQLHYCLLLRTCIFLCFE